MKLTPSILASLMGGILHPLLPKKEKKTPSFLEEVGDSNKIH